MKNKSPQVRKARARAKARRAWMAFSNGRGSWEAFNMSRRLYWCWCDGVGPHYQRVTFRRDPSDCPF